MSKAGLSTSQNMKFVSFYVYAAVVNEFMSWIGIKNFSRDILFNTSEV